MKNVLIKSTTAAFALIMIGAGSANAAVTVDELGNGFVGKGEVQTVHGWNNAALQAGASGVVFTREESATYDVDCEWETVTGGPKSKTIVHNVTQRRSTRLSAVLNGDPRQKNGQKQFTGYVLAGNEAGAGVGGPAVGDTCPGNSGVGTVTGSTLTESSNDLFVDGHFLASLPTAG